MVHHDRNNTIKALTKNSLKFSFESMLVVVNQLILGVRVKGVKTNSMTKKNQQSGYEIS